MRDLLYFHGYILVIFICIKQLAQGELILKQANVIVRHGARSPYQLSSISDNYPIDWPQGYGQLTKVGMQQMFDRGKFLQSYYGNFINSTYKMDEIYIRSTDYDRTLMSAEVILAGLYPPSGYQVWNPDLAWQPIPVHTVPTTDDWVMAHPTIYTLCPSFNVTKAENYRKTNVSYESYYNYLRNVTGLTGEYSPDALYQISDYLTSLSENGLPLPSWATESDQKLLSNEFAPWYITTSFGGANARLYADPLVTEILSNMQSVIAGGPDPYGRKMILYSGHDSNLITFMTATGTYNNIYTPSGCSLHVELFQENEDYYVMMKLRNETNQHEPLILNIAVCGGKSLCPLRNFKEALNPDLITRQEWNSACGITDNSHVIIFWTSIACITVAIIIAISTVVIMKKAGHRAKTEPVLPTNEKETSPLLTNYKKRPICTV